MRTLLQNRFATLALAILALGAIYWQREGWVARFRMTAEARTPAADETSEGEQEAAFVVTTNSPPRYLTDLATWRTLFPDTDIRRDPFAFSQREADESTPAQPNSEDIMQTAMEVQAISIQPQGRFAVINREIVGAGDSFHGFKVEKIEVGQVTLSSDVGRRVLQLRFDQVSEKPVEGANPNTEAVSPPHPQPAPK